LARLLRDVDLQEDRHRAPVTRGPTGDGEPELGPVDAVDQGEELQRTVDLVPLEVPDEVPAYVVGEEGRLLLRLLDAVLAQIGDALLEGRADTLRGKGFGDGDQGHGSRVAPGAPGSGGDLPLHGGQPGGDVWRAPDRSHVCPPRDDSSTPPACRMPTGYD
jgi:hypothetical protein